MLFVAAGFSERLLHDKMLLQVCNKSNINKEGEDFAPQEHHSLYAFPSECIFFQTLCVLISNTTKGAFQKKPYQ